MPNHKVYHGTEILCPTTDVLQKSCTTPSLSNMLIIHSALRSFPTQVTCTMSVPENRHANPPRLADLHAQVYPGNELLLAAASVPILLSRHHAHVFNLAKGEKRKNLVLRSWYDSKIFYICLRPDIRLGKCRSRRNSRSSFLRLYHSYPDHTGLQSEYTVRAADCRAGPFGELL